MRGRTHNARPVAACRIEAARDRRTLPRSSDQAIGGSLGASDEYTRMLYCHGGLRLVPDHHRNDGCWSLVRGLRAEPGLHALNGSAGKHVQSDLWRRTQHAPSRIVRRWTPEGLRLASARRPAFCCEVSVAAA